MTYLVTSANTGNDFQIISRLDMESKGYTVPAYANSIVLRAGFVPSDYWLLLSARAVNAIKASDLTNQLRLPDLVGKTLDQTGTIEEEEYEENGQTLTRQIFVATPRIFHNLQLVAADSIDPSNVDHADQVFLCRFQDARNAFKRIPIDRGYNVLESVHQDPNRLPIREFRYHPATLNAGNPWTWKAVLSDLINRLPKLKNSAGQDVDPINIDGIALKNGDEGTVNETMVGGFVSPDRRLLEPNEPYPILTGGADNRLPRYPIDLKFYGSDVGSAINYVLAITGHTLAVTDENTFVVVSVHEERSVVSRLTSDGYVEDTYEGQNAQGQTVSIDPEVLKDLVSGRLPEDTAGAANPQQSRALNATPYVNKISAKLRKPLPKTYRVLFRTTSVPPLPDNSPVPQDIYDYAGPYFTVEVDTLTALTDSGDLLLLDQLGSQGVYDPTIETSEQLIALAYKHWTVELSDRSVVLATRASQASSTSQPLVPGPRTVMGFVGPDGFPNVPSSIPQVSGKELSVADDEFFYCYWDGVRWVPQQKQSNLTRGESYLLLQEAAEDLVLRDIYSRIGDANAYSFAAFQKVHPDQLYPVVVHSLDNPQPLTTVYTSTNTFISIWSEIDSVYVTSEAPFSFQEEERPPAKWALGVVSADTDNTHVGECSLHRLTITNSSGDTVIQSDAWTDNVPFANFTGSDLANGAKIRLDWDYITSRWVALPSLAAAPPSTGRGDTAEVLNCSTEIIYPGQVLYIQRARGSRYLAARHYTHWFHRWADPTPPIDPTAAPPAATRRHGADQEGPWKVRDPIGQDYSPYRLATRNALQDRDELSLVGKLPPHTVPILYATEAGERIAEAQREYDRLRSLLPAVAVETIQPGQVGTMVVRGYARGFVYISDPNHSAAGPPPINRFRTYTENNPQGPEAGRYGGVLGVVGAPEEQDPDRRSTAVIGLPQILYSASQGPVRIIHAYRRDGRDIPAYLPYDKVTFQGDYTRRVTTENDPNIFPIKGVPGDILLVVMTGEEANPSGGTTPVASIDIAKMKANGWRALHSSITEQTSNEGDFWLHKTVFARAYSIRRTDPYKSYYLARGANTLNRTISVVEFRGGDFNKLSAVSASAPTTYNESSAPRVSTSGELYSMIQVSLGWPIP